MEDEHTLTQKELESTVKGYQLQAVNKELINVKELLKEIKDNTKGVVSVDVMQAYVDKRIDEKIKHLNEHKKSITKLGWALLLLVIGDIATRIFKL